jgi:hypothetical protein
VKCALSSDLLPALLDDNDAFILANCMVSKDRLPAITSSVAIGNEEVLDCDADVTVTFVNRTGSLEACETDL